MILGKNKFWRLACVEAQFWEYCRRESGAATECCCPRFYSFSFQQGQFVASLRSPCPGSSVTCIYIHPTCASLAEILLLADYSICELFRLFKGNVVFVQSAGQLSLMFQLSPAPAQSLSALGPVPLLLTPAVITQARFLSASVPVPLLLTLD